MLVCAIFAQFGTRDRGCSAHPAFPAPSIFEGGKEFASLGQKRAARILFVVPAQAGTHTPRRMLLEKCWSTALLEQRDPVVMGPGLRRGDDGRWSARLTRNA